MTETDVVVVVARWQTTVNHIDEVRTLLADVVPPSRAEPGCLGYETFQVADEPATVVLIEHYRDAAAMDAHRNSAHFQDIVVGRILPLLTDRRVEILTPLN